MKKRIDWKNCTYLVLSLFLFVFALFAHIFDSNVQFNNQSLSFIKDLSSTEYKCGVSESVFYDKENNCTSLRSNLRDMNVNHGFYRRSMYCYLTALNDDYTLKKNNFNYNDSIETKVSILTLSDFCDGNTSADGRMLCFPGQLMFVFDFCDIQKYKNSSALSGSYINQKLADRIINNSPNINSYDELLGTNYVFDNDRVYSICNILLSDDSMSKLLDNYYNEYIITTDYSFLDKCLLSTTTIFTANHLDFKDYYNYFSESSLSFFSMFYFENGKIIKNSKTIFFENGIMNSKKNVGLFSLYFVVPFIVFALFVDTFFIFSKYHASKFWVLMVFCFSLFILLLVNLTNSFLTTYYFILNYFNNYMSILCWINVLAFFSFLFFNKRNHKNSSTTLLSVEYVEVRI